MFTIHDLTRGDAGPITIHDLTPGGGRRDSASQLKEMSRRPQTINSVLRHRNGRTLNCVILFIGCVIGADALVGEKGLLATIRTRQQYRVLQESLADARAENARLREQARRLREVPAAIEDQARRELGLIRPGEKLFIIRELPASDARSISR